MDANEAVVEKQDVEEGNSVPKEVSCMKRLKSIIFQEKEVELTTTTEKFPLTPMGVLAHRLRTLDRSLVPPSA